jgi:hypothetical protein
MQITIGLGELTAVIAAFATITSFFWWIISNQIARSAERIEAALQVRIVEMRAERKGDVELFNATVGRLRIDLDEAKRNVRGLERIVGSSKVYDPSDREH